MNLADRLDRIEMRLRRVADCPCVECELAKLNGTELRPCNHGPNFNLAKELMALNKVRDESR